MFESSDKDSEKEEKWVTKLKKERIAKNVTMYPHTPFKGAFNNHVDRRRGERVRQMSMIVHAREGGGLGNVHVDKIFG